MNELKPGNRLRRSMLAVLACMACIDAQAQVIAPELEAALARHAPADEVAVIVYLSDRIDHRLYLQTDRSKRDNRLVKALRKKASATQAVHQVFLQNKGARKLRELWAINGIAVSANATVIRQLAARPGIASIRLDALLQAPAVTLGTTALPEWNLNAVHVPELWGLGFAGSGVVIASMDTGIDVSHPDLQNKWRGGSNSWYDPHGEHATPFDMNGHGTQTMGIMLGGSAGGTAVGVAPEARWAAVKLFNDAGRAAYSDIHLAFQWLLDPDNDMNTLDAPDVVNASWGFASNAGQCISEFNADIENLKAAAIAVVFAAGNNGPAPLTSVSPANNAAGFSTGAVDASDNVGSFSSRGQSACDGTIFPKIAAPGVDINTVDLSLGGFPLYTVVSGTSYAAPHIAGVMALLAGAFPAASVAEIEAALTQSARDLGVGGADNSYGYGMANALAAHQKLQAAAIDPPPVIAPPSFTSIPSTSATAATPYSYIVVASDTAGNAMSYTLDLAPAGMTINGTSGLVSWIPAAAQAGANAVTVRATSTTARYATQSFGVNVQANRAPVLVDDAASATVRKGKAVYPAVSISVLANDADPDTALDPANRINPVTLSITRAADKGGKASANADGTVSYIPKAGFSGSETFSYTVKDTLGLAAAASATVRVTVK